MSVQIPEIDWLERLEDWAAQCKDLAATFVTHSDDLRTDTDDDWEERFQEISQWAQQAHKQLSTDVEMPDLEALDTQARALDRAFRPLIEGEADDDRASAAAEADEDRENEYIQDHMAAAEADQDLDVTTEADRTDEELETHQVYDEAVAGDRASEPINEEVANSEQALAQSDETAMDNGQIVELSPDEKEDDDRKSGKTQPSSQAKKSEKTHVVPIGQHSLPPLPYDYDALEPHISAEIMRLHYEVHHQGYVDGLNKAEKKMQEARENGQYDVLRHWEDEAAFNGGGHYMHTIFWHNMSPDGGGKPDGAIAEEIKQTFGGFNQFKEHFTHAANQVQGVGWAMLVWSPRSRRTEILQVEKHDNLSQIDVLPLLVLDVWEHAYYLQYHNKREDYIDAWWNVVCWDNVNERFKTARNVMWQPY